MNTGQPPMRQISPPYCEGCHQFLLEFVEAVHHIIVLHDQQVTAVLGGDQEFTRLDLLINEADERKQNIKYAYLAHVEAHGCVPRKELEICAHITADPARGDAFLPA